MEYLNGGDLYSLLKKIGCLDEDVARIYIAELVCLKSYVFLFFFFCGGGGGGAGFWGVCISFLVLS